MKSQTIKKRCFWGLILASFLSILSGCFAGNVGVRDEIEYSGIEADSDYIYDQLSEDEKALFDQMREQCEQFYYGNEDPDVRKSINGMELLCCGDFDKGNLRDHEVEQVAQYFCLSCPKYFFLENRPQMMFKENGEYAFILRKGYDSREVINTYRDQIEYKTKEWLESIRDLDDDLLKEKAAYEYILENVEYDFDTYNAWMQYKNEDLYGVSTEETGSYNMNCDNIVGLFVDGKVVCSGYSRAMQYLCNVAGLDSLYVESSRGEHVWNMVKLYDDWYCIDVTWMDTGGDATPDSKIVNKSYETFRSNDDSKTDDPLNVMRRYHTMHGFMQKMGPKCVRDTVGEQCAR